jgi:hypothetical protein
MFFEEYTFDKLVQATTLVLVLNVLCSLIAVRMVKMKKEAVIYLCLLNIPLALVSGAYIGTFYSHGFDIPWLVYGLVVSLPSLLLGLLLIGFTPRTWLKK